MKTNVGGWDRNMRWILGSAAVAAAITGRVSTGWRVALIGFGATELITAATRYCPLNEAMGINTAYAGALEEAAEVAESIA